MKELGKVILFFCFLLVPSFVYADAGIKLTAKSFLGTLFTLFLTIFIEASYMSQF